MAEQLPEGFSCALVVFLGPRSRRKCGTRRDGGRWRLKGWSRERQRGIGLKGEFWRSIMNKKEFSASAAGAISLGGEISVNRLGFGAMRLNGEGIWGPPRDRKAALAVLRRAVELGINFIDTADSYGPNVSEELIAEALFPYPAGLVIAT